MVGDHAQRGFLFALRIGPGEIGNRADQRDEKIDLIIVVLIFSIDLCLPLRPLACLHYIYLRCLLSSGHQSHVNKKAFALSNSSLTPYSIPKVPQGILPLAI